MMSVSEQDAAAAIKARMVSLTVLELFSTDLEELDRQLLEKVAQAPKFFRNAPVMIDFGQLDQEVDGSWLEKACELLSANNFVPVGITGAKESLEFAARARNIAVWPAAGTARHDTVVESPQPEIKEEPVQSPPAPQEAVTPQEAPHTETLVIRQPVRSGQKVYARGGDLIVLASVSTGAEIMADGHIHVYGTLRGRALAGARGKESARVFCNDLQADLVSIAGVYIINDDLPSDMRKTAVQIYLQEDQLKIESLR
ncbi:septum site-determining protein MinC [Desulfogranum marinum]|uniref:septum site-determining protein MinC n=1 Tax=Desulfogranum marinum TaxID=453220 RepID=UPI0029C7D769|nr:septum site-determining protein MinC [Desulfogranum marinum]